MAQLVGHHLFDHLGRVLQQRVEDHHLLGGAETGDVGVVAPRSLGGVGHGHLVHLGPGLIDDPHEPRGHLGIVERRERVEDRCDEHRIEESEQHGEDHHPQPAPEPPQVGRAQEPPQRDQQDDVQDQPQGQALGEVDQEPA